MPLPAPPIFRRDPRKPAYRAGRWLFLLTLLALLPLAGVSGARQVAAEPSAASGTVGAHSAAMPAGHAVTAQQFATPPRLAPAEQQQLAARQAVRDSRPAPARQVSNVPLAAPNGPQTSPGASRQAATTLTIFRNNTLPPGGQFSGVNEPSTDGTGRNVFQTGNWYAAYSHNNGANWTYLNPFNIFGSGFCCDQVTAYDPTHDRQFWLAQFGDHDVLANSRSGNLASWCYYNWSPASFGLPAAYEFDYPHMAISTNYVYVSTNVYNGNSFVGALVYRTPIDPQASCAGFSYSWFGPRNSEFADAFAQGAGDVMYWGTDNSSLGVGGAFRVLRWADNSNTINWFDRSINGFAYMNVNGGRCGSTDGVVLNWCQRTDSRMSGGGYVSLPTVAQNNTGGVQLSTAILGFAFNANSDSAHPWPYIRRIYFRVSDLAYLGYSEIWSSGNAILYPDEAADSRGHVGIIWAFGGGANGAHYYPGSGFTLDDDIAPTQPWSYSYFLYGAGNACLNTADNTRRYGDYLTVRAANPARDAFLASTYALTANAGSCGSTAPVAPHNLVFGRARDQVGWLRFANS